MLQIHVLLTIIKLLVVWHPQVKGHLVEFEAQLHPTIALYLFNGLQIPLTGVEL